jgi:hypothetical protein
MGAVRMSENEASVANFFRDAVRGGDALYIQNIFSYIQDFPYHDYELCEVPTQGLFYIDAIDDLIKNFLRNSRPWEPIIMGHLRKHVTPGSTAIDAGAHIGTHTLYMSKLVGPQGSVHAFEPQPKIFRELFMNCLLNQTNNVSLYPVALGSNIPSSSSLKYTRSSKNSRLFFSR